MPHPIMFRDDDPGLTELRRIAFGFPEAFEKISHGRPTFCAPKMFAIFGGNAKVDGTMVSYPHSVLVKVDESDRRALAQDNRFYSPMYLAPSGWMGLDLAAALVDWREVGELIDASFRLTAPARLIRLLDGL